MWVKRGDGISVMGMQDAPAASRMRVERERESLVWVRREEQYQVACSSAKRVRGA